MQFLRERIRFIAVVIIVGLSLVVAQWIGVLKPVEFVVSAVFQPMQSAFYGIIDRARPLYSATDETLLEENTQLKEQLANTATRTAELEEQIQQYEEYESQLAFAQENDYTYVPAEIVSRIGQGITTQTIIINLGTSDDVEAGYPVVYNDGTLVGIVDRAEETYAEVALLTGSLVTVQASIQNEAQTSGLISGEFGTGLRMDLILKDNPITTDDIVVTNGQDAFIPKGLLIGTVQEVSDESSELFKSATVSSIVRYNSNSIVSVIIPR